MRKGQRMSDEARQNLSKKHKANPRLIAHCLKMAEDKKGTHHSLKTRQKMSVTRKGKPHAPHSLVTRQKISAALTGRHLSPETIKKAAEARRGRIVSPETREKQSVALRGRIITIEARRKLSKAAIERYKSPELRRRIGEYHKGIHPSDEARRRMSAARKGKPHSIEHNRKMKETLNRPEVRRKISEALKGRPSPNWKGGLSFQEYSLQWTTQLKEYIRQRDDYTCQLCHMPENGRHHSIHHISYDKKSSSEHDLITTCVSCNSRVNGNRSRWTRYFRLLMWAKYGIDYPISVGGI